MTRSLSPVSSASFLNVSPFKKAAPTSAENSSQPSLAAIEHIKRWPQRLVVPAKVLTSFA